MPAEFCPRCGTPRTAGSCACDAVSAAEETAVLPHLEGPPLVRPYVAGTQVVEPGDPAADPFATRVGPPPVQPVAAPPGTVPPVAVPTSAARPPAVQPITGPPPPPGGTPPPPPNRAPHVPQSASPFGPPQPAAPAAPPHPDAAATQLLPPVPPQQTPAQQAPPQQTPQQPGAPAQGAPGRFVPIPPPGTAPDPGPVPAVERTMPLTLGPVPPRPAPAGHPPVPPPADAGATQLLELGEHDQQHDPQHGGDGPDDGRWPEEPAADLGMFTFREDDDADPVSRADRREQRRQSADRRRLVIAGGAVGVTALGVALAMMVSSGGPTKVDNTLPAPTGPAVTAPAEVTPSPAGPSPTAESSAPASPEESPSPTRSTSRPTQAVTSKAAAAPTAEAPPAPSSPAAAQSSTPPPSAGKVLKFGDTGPEVTQMQQALMAYRCDRIGPLTIDRTRSGQVGFGDWTRQVLSGVQHDLFGDGKPKQYQDGVYDAATQAALAATPRGTDC